MVTWSENFDQIIQKVITVAVLDMYTVVEYYQAKGGHQK